MVKTCRISITMPFIDKGLSSIHFYPIHLLVCCLLISIANADHDTYQKESNLILMELDKSNRLQFNMATGDKSFPWVAIPWLVAIYKGQSFKCAGTILNYDYIITAAKCIDPKRLGDYTVVAGESNLYCGEGTEQRSGVKELITHFTRDQDIHAVVIVKLDTPFVFSEYVKRVAIVAARTKEPDVNQIAEIAGWGKTGPNDPLSPVVRIAKLARTNQSHCDLKYDGTDFQNRICFTGVKRRENTVDPGSPACDGDEGAPIMCGDKRELCAIAVHTEACGIIGKLDTSVNIVPYINWTYHTAKMDHPEDPHPEKTLNATAGSNCGEYEELNSGILNVTNILNGYTCTYVIKTKYSTVRFRLLSSTLQPSDRLAVSSVCDKCDELVMLEVGTDYTTTQRSLVMISLLAGVGLPKEPQSRKRNFTLLFKASGYIDDEEPLSKLVRWNHDAAGDAEYPTDGGTYFNNRRVMFIFHHTSSERNDLNVTFVRLDVKNPHFFACLDGDRVDFFYTEWVNNAARSNGKHIRFSSQCSFQSNSEWDSDSFIWKYGFGFAIFLSNNVDVGYGFKFKYDYI